jgi:hypothetical protein
MIAMVRQKPRDAKGTWNALYEFDCYHRARKFFDERSARLFAVDPEDLVRARPVDKVRTIPAETLLENGAIEYRHYAIQSVAECEALCMEINYAAALRNLARVSWVPGFQSYNRFLGDKDQELVLDPTDRLAYVTAAICCAQEQDRVQHGRNVTFRDSTTNTSSAWFGGFTSARTQERFCARCKVATTANSKGGSKEWPIGNAE